MTAARSSVEGELFGRAREQEENKTRTREENRDVGSWGSDGIKVEKGWQRDGQGVDGDGYADN